MAAEDGVTSLAYVAGIHAMKPGQPTTICRCGAAWMAGTSPALTFEGRTKI
jgi:hypothetical protein